MERNARVLTAKFVWEIEVEESPDCTGCLVYRVDDSNSGAVKPKVPDEALVPKNGSHNTCKLRVSL
jgi:hypothetical protein